MQVSTLREEFGLSGMQFMTISLITLLSMTVQGGTVRPGQQIELVKISHVYIMIEYGYLYLG